MFTDQAFNTNHTRAEVLFQQFTNRANTTVRQVVYIVNRILAVNNICQRFQNRQEVALCQQTFVFGLFTRFDFQALVHFETAHCGQIIVCRVKSLACEQIYRRFQCRTFTRTDDVINFYQCFFTICGFIRHQCVAHVRRNCGVVNSYDGDLLYIHLSQIRQDFFCDFSTRREYNIATVCNRFEQVFANQRFRHQTKCFGCRNNLCQTLCIQAIALRRQYFVVFGIY